MILFQTKGNNLNCCKLLFLQFVIIWSLIITTADAADNSVWFDGDFHNKTMIQVKFVNDSPLKVISGKLSLTDNNQQYSLLVDSLKNSQFKKWQPVFKTDVSTLKQWNSQATEKSLLEGTNKTFADLSQFFYLHLEEEADPAQIIAQLRQLPLIEGVYPVSNTPIEPPLPPDYENSNDGNLDNDNVNIYQKYLDAAPDGMDIHYAREGIGGRGNGIDVCDVEYDYNFHLDLLNVTKVQTPISNIPFVSLLFPFGYSDHGTAVLGMLNSGSNGFGTTGMITEADIYFSPVIAIENILPTVNIPDAISECMSQMSSGSVILIEQQLFGRNNNYVPVEWDPSVYAIINVATALGFTVVEAAGNGGENLDHVFYTTAQPGHTPFASNSDSGAIIVGAGASAYKTEARTRIDFSTYGSTVDLQGWGQDVVTTGYDDLYFDDGGLLSYTLFSGTSSASPMVTAAVAIIQANYIAKNGTPATPATIKQLLISTGTPQTNVNGENIGPLPDLKNAINTLWNFNALTQPVISPSTGVYAPPQAVTIDYGSANQNSSNTHIRYTLDGSEPTIDSFIYIPEAGDVIHLLYTTTVKAAAFQSFATAERFFASPVTTEIIALIAPTVATPEFTPDGGVFTQPQSISISTATPGATIKYRTDGRAPSLFYPGTTYSGPINLSAGTYYFTARGYKDGLYNSDAAFAAQLIINPIILPAPTIFPSSGEFVGSATLYMGSTVLGSTIRYTTDGSTPSSSSDIYVNPVVIDSTTTVKARIYLSGYSPSASVAETFTVISQASAPTISPNSGSTANDTMQVTLSTTTNGASIRYTTNSLEPTETSALYSSPFSLSPGQYIVKARAFLNNAQASTVSSATLTVYDTSITVSPPTISPVGGIFNGPVTVTLTSDTQGVSLIFYTLNGTDPATSPDLLVYNGPFNLDASGDSYFIRARAFLSGSGNSNMSAGTFTVVDPTLGTVVTPTITPVSGEYNNTVAVSVQAPDYSSPFRVRKLYVTRNGDVPFADFSTQSNGVSGVYNFNLSKAETVKALSAQQGWLDSDIAENVYSFKCAAPDVSTGGTFVNSTSVSISTVTTNATIYYTVDGSDPTTSDSQYSTPITVNQDQVVKAMCTRNNFAQSDVSGSVFLITNTAVAPNITTQPQSIQLKTCDNGTLSVVASGTSPFSYQWYKDGNVIGGATNADLDLYEVNPDISGNYHVTVTNDAGTVTSNTATIIVPIFANSFEAGEINTTCSANNRSNDGNNKSMTNNLNNQPALVSALSDSAFNTGNKAKHYSISTSNAVNKQSKNSNGLGGGEPVAVVIPTLHLWAKLLLSLLLMLGFYFFNRKKPQM